MAKFNDAIAVTVGVNAAIIAELIMNLLNEEGENVIKKYGKVWCRCSVKMATVYCPYFSEHQVEHSLKVLYDRGIISKEKLNTSKFDHTNWYAFTEFGTGLIGANK